MKEPSTNNLFTQTGDVIDNPENPVNPDSKPDAGNDQNKIILYAKARKFFLYW
jgi:hypothetical protein